MAENSVLKMTFAGPDDKKNLLFSFGYADESKAAAVKPLMEGIVANKEIFEVQPRGLIKAEFVKTETTVTPVDLA